MCEWKWVWVLGKRRGQSGAVNLGNAPGSRGEGGAADSGPEGGSLWTPQESRRCLGWVARPAGACAPARSLAAALTSFRVAARPHHRRPEAGGAPGACASPAIALPPPRAVAAGAHLACCHPCFVIVPEPLSCIGN